MSFKLVDILIRPRVHEQEDGVMNLNRALIICLIHRHHQCWMYAHETTFQVVEPAFCAFSESPDFTCRANCGFSAHADVSPKEHMSPICALMKQREARRRSIFAEKPTIPP